MIENKKKRENLEINDIFFYIKLHLTGGLRMELIAC